MEITHQSAKEGKCSEGCSLDVSCNAGLYFVGRLCLSLLFLFGAYWHITNWDVALKKTAATGVSYPNAILIIATIMLAIGGISLLAGFFTRVGAILLIFEIFLTALIFHQFWNVEQSQSFLVLLAFLARIAPCGGLFMLIAHGPGSVSIDAWRTSSKPKSY